MDVILGIDIGGSTTKIVGLRTDGSVVSMLRVRAEDQVTSLYGAFGNYLKSNGLSLSDVRRVVLTGERGEQPLDLSALEKELAGLCYGLTLRDRTRVSRDLWAKAEDDGLVGLFLQEMRARMAQSPEDETLVQAVRFGMAALEGWEEVL